MYIYIYVYIYIHKAMQAWYCRRLGGWGGGWARPTGPLKNEKRKMNKQETKNTKTKNTKNAKNEKTKTTRNGKQKTEQKRKTWKTRICIIFPLTHELIRSYIYIYILLPPLDHLRRPQALRPLAPLAHTQNHFDAEGVWARRPGPWASLVAWRRVSVAREQGHA